MVHSCAVRIDTITEEAAESVGLDYMESGKWVPFTTLYRAVVSFRLTENDVDHVLYGGTTIYTEQGAFYHIDTPYQTFKALWTEAVTSTEHLKNQTYDRRDTDRS